VYRTTTKAKAKVLAKALGLLYKSLTFLTCPSLAKRVKVKEVKEEDKPNKEYTKDKLEDKYKVNNNNNNNYNKVREDV
jgi:hypothetical protein